jgi:broad specificity polyphosphatase/5'/3'-nucleotidase SurE
MRLSAVICAALAPALGQAIRIIQSNDDGWAELYVRSFHDALLAANHDPVLSAPAENKSGSGTYTNLQQHAQPFY